MKKFIVALCLLALPSIAAANSPAPRAPYTADMPVITAVTPWSAADGTVTISKFSHLVYIVSPDTAVEVFFKNDAANAFIVPAGQVIPVPATFQANDTIVVRCGNCIDDTPTVTFTLFRGARD